MTFKNICTKKTFTKDGQEVTKWLNCGTLRVNNDNKMFIEFNDRPDITYFVFDQKKPETEEAL